MVILFWLNAYLAAHRFIVYPYSLAWTSRFKRKHERRTDCGGCVDGVDTAIHTSFPLPSVALVISTHNEGIVIGGKLKNAQCLDYPADRINVYVLSDACTDETVAIAEAFPNTTVLRSTIRKGKSAGLEEFVPEIDAEILVFSDANSLYDPRPIRFLVAPLADPTVGYISDHF